MDLAAANAKYDALHEKRPFHDGTFSDDPEAWSDKRDGDHPYHYRDGVTIWVHDVDLNPDDAFLGGGDQSAVEAG